MHFRLPKRWAASCNRASNNFDGHPSFQVKAVAIFIDIQWWFPYTSLNPGMTVTISASVINWDDLNCETNCLDNIGYVAKNILGYSTAEAN